MAFLVLEGECGLMNVVIMPQVYERFRSIFRLSRFVYVRGSVQRRERTPVIRQIVPHPIETRHFVFSVVGEKNLLMDPDTTPPPLPKLGSQNQLKRAYGTQGFS
jgi:DNA polymerase III alpha subunit